MGNKRLINNLIIFLILMVMVGCCSGQPIVTIPKAIVPTTAHQFMVWDGSTFKLKELVGFTVTSTQMTIPSSTDGSISNEGLLGVGAGSGTSSVLLTNTSTGTGVTINASSPLNITESTSSNGGSITLSVAVADPSASNEGQLSLTGNMFESGATLNSNTSGSSIIKIVGRAGVGINRNVDTLFLTNTANIILLTNHVAVTSSNTTMVTVFGSVIECEEGEDKEFTIYIHYTTGTTSQGLQFRINNTGSGTFWYDYNFPITGSRVTGSIYNANTTITIPSSESGTNIAVIRGISKSAGVGLGIFELNLQISAEDGSSTVSVLTTGATRR